MKPKFLGTILKGGYLVINCESSYFKLAVQCDPRSKVLERRCSQGSAGERITKGIYCKYPIFPVVLRIATRKYGNYII